MNTLSCSASANSFSSIGMSFGVHTSRLSRVAKVSRYSRYFARVEWLACAGRSSARGSSRTTTAA